MPILPASPFAAPWIKPSWHSRIIIGRALSESRIWGREVVGFCWLWCGWQNGKGHGRVKHRGRGTYLHRLSLASYHGLEVAELDTCDHICVNRNCFHPWHVESVTPIENYERGLGPAFQFRPPEEYDDQLAADLRGW
jgi:hypothetical protein